MDVTSDIMTFTDLKFNLEKWCKNELNLDRNDVMQGITLFAIIFSLGSKYISVRIASNSPSFAKICARQSLFIYVLLLLTAKKFSCVLFSSRNVGSRKKAITCDVASIFLYLCTEPTFIKSETATNCCSFLAKPNI